MTEFDDNEQLDKIACNFFKQLNIPVTHYTLRKQLLSHPDYPSLASLSDVCNEFNIDHVALEKKTIEELKKNGFPVIAFTKDKKATFVIIEDINENIITYYHPKKNRIKEKISSFQDKWDGVVFYAVPDSNSGEEDYTIKRIQELFFKARLPFLVLSCTILIGYTLLNLNPTLDLFFLSLLIVKITGLYVSINLVIHSFGESTKITEKVCNGGEHTNCEDVLNSPASKLFGLLSMSDIGFAYFTGGLFSMLLAIYLNTTQPTITFLLLISLYSIPYICFSVYYQKFKVKKWCPLCLSVMSVLLIESLIFLLCRKSLDYDFLHFSVVGISSLCFIITICIWAFIKPLISKAKEGEQYEYSYLRLKKNPHIYNAQLSMSPSFEMKYSSADPVIGYTDATLTITSVVNTYCAPCAKTHEKLAKVLSDNAGKIKLVTRFMVTSEKEALHLLEVYNSQGSEVFEKALDDWFKTKDYNQLTKKYPIAEISTTTKETLNKQKEWCYNLSIDKTPTLFINDKKIGLEYTLDDIQWLVHNILNS